MTHIEVNPGAIEQLLKLPVSYLRKRANKIQAACGDGYEAEVDIESNRASAAVFTRTAAAMADNHENNTLIKNLDAGR